MGAYLPQNTSWTNVERAIRNLRTRGVLTLRGVRELPLSELEQLIRSAGYFRQKAQRLKTFITYLDSRYAGSLTRMFARHTAELRAELLALNGVGPETADSILLYAGNHPVFVVDAYTRRIAVRHRLISDTAPYDEIRALFEWALSPIQASPSPVASGDGKRQLLGAAHAPSAISNTRRPTLVQTLNEMHGLIVGLGKNHCFKARPQCENCPLQPFLDGCGTRK